MSRLRFAIGTRALAGRKWMLRQQFHSLTAACSADHFTRCILVRPASFRPAQRRHAYCIRGSLHSFFMQPTLAIATDWYRD